MARSPKYTFEQFFTTNAVLPTFDFAPDGQAIAYVADYTGYFNLYRQELSGGEPLQLTDSTHLKPNALVWAPDGYIYFLADQDGDEQSGLYRTAEAGGAVESLTDRPDTQYVSLHLSRDGGALYYTGNPINPIENHLFRRDLATGTERLIGGGPGIWSIGHESANGRFLTLIQMLSRTNERIHLWDGVAGELRELTAGRPAARRKVGPWEGDEGFLFLSDEEGEFVQAYCHHLAGAVDEPCLTPAHDVVSVFGTGNGAEVGFVVNENGYFRLQLASNDSDPEALRGGVIEAVAPSPDGAKLAVLLRQANRPDDLLIWDRSTGAVKRLTNCLVGNLDPVDMVVPELVEIPGPDHPIPAWLYRPARVADGEQVPILLSFHGGPEVQELPIWEPIYQYLLDLGIAILAPNIRGSAGYGKSYQRLIYRDWGGGDLRDMEACAQWAQAQPWVRPGKMAVYGASYGGFAALSCATRLPDYWRCAIDFCGPSNLVTLAKSLPISFKARLKHWLGDPEEDRDFLLARSPISYVDQVRCPMMIIQGAQDPRVLKAESDQMALALQGRSVPVEYLLFPDEGHGLDKQVNKLACWRKMGEFLLEHLS